MVRTQRPDQSNASSCEGAETVYIDGYKVSFCFAEQSNPAALREISQTLISTAKIYIQDKNLKKQ